MTDVFLSYARKDIERAEAIRDGLRELGLEVFFDMEGLDGGDVFPDVLDKAVKSAKAVVGVWSAHALTRPWVKIECDIGRRRGVLVPVQIEQIDDLDRPAAFWNMQYDDLSQFDGDVTHSSWIRFIRSLSRTLNRPDLLTEAKRRVAPAPEPAVQPASVPSPFPSIKQPAKSRSPAGAIVFGAVAILLSLTAIVLWTVAKPPEQLADGSSSDPEASIAAVTTAAKSAEGEAANDAAWEAASKDGSTDALNAYLKLFPNGSHAVDAKNELNRLERLAANERAAKQVEAAKAAEQAAWNTASATNTSAAYESFLRAYPSGRYSATADDRLKTARRNEVAAADDAAWNAAKASNTAVAYFMYLASYPAGRHSAEAEQARSKLIAPAPTQSPPSTNTGSASGKTTLLEVSPGVTVGGECRTVRQLVVVNGQEEAQDVQFCRASPNGQWERKW